MDIMDTEKDTENSRQDIMDTEKDTGNSKQDTMDTKQDTMDRTPWSPKRTTKNFKQDAGKSEKDKKVMTVTAVR
jgi:hypothetical protein